MERVGFLHQSEAYANQLRLAQSRYAELQQQVMTGKRLARLSDDAIGGRALISTAALKAAAERFKQNIEVGKAEVKFAEGSLGDMQALLNRAYERAVYAANSTVTQEGMLALAEEVTSLQERLLDLANSQGPGGDYLFAGTAVSVKPFSVSGTTLTYHGNNNSRFVEVQVGETVSISMGSGTMIRDAYAALESLRTNLIGGNISAISGVDLQLLRDAASAIGSERAEAGSRLNMLDARSMVHTRRIDEFTIQISNIEEIDLSEAIVKYQAAQVAYTAALNVTSQAFNLSLMDFLR